MTGNVGSLFRQLVLSPSQQVKTHVAKQIYFYKLQKYTGLTWIPNGSTMPYQSGGGGGGIVQHLTLGSNFSSGHCGTMILTS